MSVRFSLDGELFELTAELVRRRLAGHVPEDIRVYWVEIDGVRWPVKQVIALATGAERSRFQSQDARRWLRSLGFRIGAGDSDIAAASSASRALSSRLRFDPGACEVREPVELQFHIRFEWLRVGKVSLDATGLPRFPALPRVPGLYRLDFGIDENGMRTLYIGESGELARMASDYRNAKTECSRQPTSRRIHKKIAEHLTANGTIEFDIATEVHLGDGLPTDLRLKSARRLAENAAVLSAQAAPHTRVLDVDTDLGAGDSGD